MKKKIILIEDNPGYMKKMLDALEGEGNYEVESASDGKAGLKLVKSSKPDLVVLELTLPQISGLRLINELKSDPHFRDLHILALTPVMVNGLRDGEGFTIGCDKHFNADHVLNKPFDEDDFLDKVEDILFEDRPKRKTGKEKILLVDDDPSIIKLLIAILEKENYDTVEAVNGKKGLEMIKHEKPDLVLLDLMMPEMNGAQVLEIIKKEHPELPVIIVTAHGSEDKAVDLMKGGAIDYIKKPFDREEVLARVREGVKKSRLLSMENHFNARLAETTELLLAQMEKVEESPYRMRHIVLTFIVTLIGAIIGIYLALTTRN
ncbi:MAG: response regulator [Nitrospinae bacterium]|nr:response regulator [Nitrospinota bacterium]